MEFGKNLKKLREKRGLSISECAKVLSVSPSTFRDWEYGRSISGEPYLKLAELFNISLSELFGHERGKTLAEIEKIEASLESLLGQVKTIKCYL